MTNLPRRTVLQWTAGAAAWMAAPAPLPAQSYPTRPLYWIVGFPPGGAADIITRLVAASLSQRLGQQVIVDNRPGAGTNVATRAVLDAPPDGHTLLLIGSSTVVNALLHEQSQPNLLPNIVPVAGLTVSAFVIAVNSSAPEVTFSDLIGFAKENPGKLKVGSYGIGTQSHLAAHLFMTSAGIDAVHVPYRGGAPLVNDLLGGHIHVAFDTVASSLPHIRSGALRALAVTTSSPPVSALPDVPAASELLPGFEIAVWIGLGVRKGTPLAAVERLNAEINAILADPAIRDRIADLSITSISCELEQCRAAWSQELDRTSAQIRDIGLKLE